MGPKMKKKLSCRLGFHYPKVHLKQPAYEKVLEETLYAKRVAMVYDWMCGSCGEVHWKLLDNEGSTAGRWRPKELKRDVYGGPSMGPP